MSLEELIPETNFLNQKDSTDYYDNLDGQESHELDELSSSQRTKQNAHETIEIEEPIVEQNSNENEITKIIISNCRIKADMFKCLESSTMTEKVLLIYLKFIDNLPILEQEDLQQVNTKFSNKSIVVVLECKNGEHFSISWKSMDVQHFWVLKTNFEGLSIIDRMKLKTFVIEFLMESLKNQHTGLMSQIVQHQATKSLELDFLADSRDFNLLFIATERGNADLVKILMKLRQSTKSLDNKLDVRELALEHNHQDIFLIFLKANMTYPRNFKVTNCTGKLKEFCDITAELHQLIIDNNVEKVKKILDQHEGMRLFYNRRNQSAARVALQSRSFDTYRLLLSRQCHYGPHENPKVYLDELEEFNKRLVRDIHTAFSQHFDDKHINILMANSHVFQGQSDGRDKRKVIQHAFEVLNSNPFIQIILKIVAAATNFKLIFDFNRDTVNIVDPTVDEYTQGLFYLSGKIYIGAKQLLNSATEDEAIATLIHEMCHFAMFLVFRNNARPYESKDKQTQQEFEEISRECEEKQDKETFIRLVYDCYSSDMEHAELIVRVVHLLALYRKLPEKLMEVRDVFSRLFEFYEKKVFPELKKALPEIEGRNKMEIKKKDKKISKLKRYIWLGFILSILSITAGIYITFSLFWTCQYNNLSNSQKILIENSTVQYKNEKLLFHEFFPKHSIAYGSLKSEDCSSLFNGHSLNLSSENYHYLYDDVSIKPKIIRETLSTAAVLYKNVDVKFCDLFSKNSTIFSNLTSDTVSQMLKGKQLDMDNELLHYLKIQVNLNWVNLTQKLKQRFLDSNLIFQNEKIPFHALYDLSPKSFEFLTNEQINAVLSNKTLVIHKMIKNETDFYIERKFRNENLFEIFYFFANFFEGANRNVSKNCVFKNKTKIETTFEDFYAEFTSENFTVQIEKIDKLNKNPDFLDCTKTLVIKNPLSLEIIDSPKVHKLFTGLDFNDTLEEVEVTKFYILSAEAGAGKTITFEQYTLWIKKKFPTRWVSYVDFKDHKKLYNSSGRVEDVNRLLEDIFGLDSKHEFERRIFWELFESGNVILMWNGFDEISPQFSDFILDVLRFIRTNSNNIQFVCTRPLYKDQLSLKFKSYVHNLIPLDEQAQEEFLTKFFISKNIDEQKIPDYIEKVYKIIKSAESSDNFDTPLLLGMIAELISNDVEIYESENLFEIYQKSIRIKIKIWKQKSDFANKFVEDLITQHRKFDMMELYQKFALKSEFGSLKKYANMKNLEIMVKSFPMELTNDEISRMGILFINGPEKIYFAHKTFAEFFIAQYLIDNIIFEDGFLSNVESESRFELFVDLLRSDSDTEDKVINFIIHFLKTKMAKSLNFINTKFVDIIRSKYLLILFDWLGKSKYFESWNIFITVSKNNHKLLTEILQIDENVTLSTASYNFYFYNSINSYQADYYSMESVAQSLLTADEFEKFMNGKNQKGIILLSLYCFRSYKQWFINHDKYELSDEILESNDKYHVFFSIANNLTKEEFSEILLTKKSPFYVTNFVDLIYDRRIWEFVEKRFTKEEQKIILMECLRNENFNVFKDTEKVLLRQILQLGEVMSENESLKFFSSTNIFQITYFKPDFFESLWNFFLNHSNHEQQKEILSMRCENSNLTVIQKVLIYTDDKNLKIMSKIYKQYFTNSEIQELISYPDDFFFRLVAANDFGCNQKFHYLREVFMGNENALKILLGRKYEENLDIFEYFHDDADLYPCYENFNKFYLNLS